MSLVLRLPRETHLCRSSWNVPHLPSFLERCRKTTSETSKAVRACGVFNILTWKRALRHNGVQLFNICAPNLVCFVHFDFALLLNISTSKSGPKPSVFSTFDLDMCFAPQRRAIFWHVNFQKCSGNQTFKNMCVFLNELLKQALRLFRPTAGSRNCRWRTARSLKKGKARWTRRQRMTCRGRAKNVCFPSIQYTRIWQIQFRKYVESYGFPKMGYPQIETFYSEGSVFGNEHNS